MKKVILLSLLILLVGCATPKVEETTEISDVLEVNLFPLMSGHTYSEIKYTSDNGTNYFVTALSMEGDLMMNYKESSTPGITLNSEKEIKRIDVVWGFQEAATAYYTPNYVLDIYSKEDEYAASNDLYNSSLSGVVVGSITRNNNETSYTLSTPSKHIGLTSKEGKIRLQKIVITYLDN